MIKTISRQYRTIRGARLACILFRRTAQKSASIRQYASRLFVHPDEKSDCAIRTPELCGIALKIDGMMCSMCESHVNDTVRQGFGIKKVSSSHTKGMTEIISEEPLDENALIEAVGRTGYRVLEIKTEPYEKKRFSLFGRK